MLPKSMPAKCHFHLWITKAHFLDIFRLDMSQLQSTQKDICSMTACRCFHQHRILRQFCSGMLRNGNFVFGQESDLCNLFRLKVFFKSFFRLSFFYYSIFLLQCLTIFWLTSSTRTSEKASSRRALLDTDRPSVLEGNFAPSFLL